MKPTHPSAVETLASGAASRQALGSVRVQTRGQGLIDLTPPILKWVAETGIRTGLLTVFCRHTSASLTIQENADPAVRHDLLTALDRLAPREARYMHAEEGPDDMPAHIRAMLTGVSLSVPVQQGAVMVGVWQGIFLVEHRDRPHMREIILHLTGMVSDV